MMIWGIRVRNEWTRRAAGILAACGIGLAGEVARALPAPPDFELDVEVEKGEAPEFERLVLSASKSAQSVEEAPAVISVITAEDIRRSGYRSVGEALRSVPGVYLLDDHFKGSLGVRGISGGARGWSSIVKVLINGQPVSFRPDTTNFLGPELISIEAVKQIEVIRGPLSALYGANAFLGVINILTKSGEDLGRGRDAGALVSGGGAVGSAFNEVGASGAVGTRLGPIDIMVSGGYTKQGRSGLTLPFDCASDVTCKTSPGGMLFQTRGNLESKNDDAVPYNIFGQVAYHASKAANITLDGSMQRFSSGAEFMDWGPLSHDSKVVENNGFLRLAFDGSAGKASYRLFGAYVAGSPGGGDRFTRDEGGSLFFKRRVDYKGVDAGGEFKLELAEKSSITVGVDTSIEDHQLQVFDIVDRMTGMVSETDDARVSSATVKKCIGDGRCGFNNVAGYAQAIFYPVPKLGLTGGFRVDRHNIYGVQPNGRFGVVFLPSEKLAIKALYGGSFKAPSPVQLFTTPLGPRDILGNEDLKAQSANTFEGAFVISPIRQLRAELTGYVTFISDQVQFQSDGGNQKAKNVADVRSIGGEADINYQPISMLRTFVQASFVKSEVTAKDAAGMTLPTVDLEEFYPALILRGGGMFVDDRHYFSIGLDGTYVSSRGASQANVLLNAMKPYSLDAYFSLGASAGTRNLRLFGQRETALRVRADNLLNQKYAEPGFAGIDIPAYGARVWMTLSQEI